MLRVHDPQELVQTMELVTDIEEELWVKIHIRLKVRPVSIPNPIPHRSGYVVANTTSASLQRFVNDDVDIQIICVFTLAREARTALNMRGENRDRFDLIISDVHMPDMDGFKLMELVGLEMDLPVISKRTYLI
ncbi:hypothetical protein POM88_020771 [Heracleum sosnowskyi]|uniref:Response regulatory domain-containing protein n=1 Tax=Heracleum sosnowskyi TaxID=360622 RepID=A0AAD8IDK3_9APIA|nr:hypothetical protein POM88_020771 [Heracleum sosnowskyi]